LPDINGSWEFDLGQMDIKKFALNTDFKLAAIAKSVHVCGLTIVRN